MNWKKEHGGEMEYDVLVIGGGPAGASCAIELARAGRTVVVVERRAFPREVVCGEFLSHEVLSALRCFDVYEEFLSLRPQPISTFVFIPESGVPVARPLGFPAAAMKRSILDDLLLRRARSCGAKVMQPAEVVSISPHGGGFEVSVKRPSGNQVLSARNVVAAYGRSGNLDKALQRDFTNVRSGMTGVKYHVPRGMFKELQEDQIRIYSTQNIYCGLNRVGDNEATLCYLTRAEDRTPWDSLMTLLERNRSFRSLFRGDPLSELATLPRYGTGNIFFGKRSLVEDGVLMTGDAAGVLGPLAGDGIGMAVEGGRLVANVLLQCAEAGVERRQMERRYTAEWRRRFAVRLRTAAFLQALAMKAFTASAGGMVMTAFPSLADAMIRSTRSHRLASSLAEFPSGR